MVSISVVARPNSMPWVLRNTMPSELPPTAEGVTQLVNSHSKSTLYAWLQRSCLSVSSRKRHERPKSRPNMQQKARKMQKTAQGVNRMHRHTSARSSLRAS